MKKRVITAACLILSVACCLGAVFLCRGKGEQAVIDITGMEDINISTGEELPDLTAGIEKTESVAGIRVDASAVDRDNPGEYGITYYYEDENGNQFSKTITCTVTEAAPAEDEASTQEITPAETEQEAGEDKG